MKKGYRKLPIIIMVIFGLAFSCAFDVIRVRQEPAQFEPNASDQDAWALGQDTFPVK